MHTTGEQPSQSTAAAFERRLGLIFLRGCSRVESTSTMSRGIPNKPDVVFLSIER